MKLYLLDLGHCDVDKGVVLTPGSDRGVRIDIPIVGYLIEADSGERVLVDTGMAIIEPAMRLWRNWKRRDDLAILGELDEHLLDDIGLTAADVREALALPLADNASRMLAGRAHRSRQAWRLLGQR